jgi:hypothetical protein
MVRTSARARHDLDTLAEYLVEDLERQTFEQRDPGLERSHEVELAVHGPARDRADLRFDPEVIGRLVDAFDRDHGRVHVAHQEALAARCGRHDLDIVGQIAERRLRSRADLLACGSLDQQLAGLVLGQPARRAADRPLQHGNGRAIQRRPLRIADEAYGMSHGADCPRTTPPMQAAVP